MTAAAGPAQGATVLEATCARLLPPGANRPGMATDTPWVILLPDPTPGVAWIVGRPGADEIAGMARVADRVRLLDTPTRAADLDERLIRLGVDPGRVATGPGSPAEVPDLLWLRRDARGSGSVGLEALAADTIAAGGVAFSERAGDRGGDWQLLRVGPLIGPVRQAHAANDRDGLRLARRRRLAESAARRWLAGHGVPRPRPMLRRVVALEQAIAARLPRTAALAGRSVDVRRPPMWLRDLAAGAGLDVTDLAWAFVAPGDYATQKVLLVLGAREEAADGAILVKVALDPIGVPRIDAAAAALRRLGTIPVAADRVPGLRFAGHVGNLGILAEAVADGRPFERLSAAAARLAAADLVAWLSALAVATAVPADRAALRAGLDRIVTAYVAAYEPDKAERAAIEMRVAAVIGADSPVPAVFLHGDPGVQNLLVNESGRVTALDWENGDPAGLPLWDVAMFLRSYVLWSTTGRGRGSRFAAVRRHLADGSAMTPDLAAALGEYRRRVGIAPALVEPLVTLGWVWLAARDAARLDPARAAEGQGVRVARLFLERGPRCAIFGDVGA